MVPAEARNLLGGINGIACRQAFIVIAGHKTSVSLEDAFWRGLKEIASTRHVTLSALVSGIDSGRTNGNLSSAIRLVVLAHYRAMISAPAPAASQNPQMEIHSIG
jgi:predicted DNA-binding ribbon-helix-helix protein